MAAGEVEWKIMLNPYVEPKIIPLGWAILDVKNMGLPTLVIRAIRLT